MRPHGSLILAIPLVVTALCVSGTALAAAAPDIVKEWGAVKAPPPPAIKAVKIDPKKTALFVMDFNQKNCLPADRVRCAASIPHVKMLLDEARAHNMTVVFTHTHRMTPKDISTELTPRKGELVYQGNEDKLYDSDVPKNLKAMGVDTLILTGTQASGALLLTSIGAALRGFHVVVPIDGMPAETAYQEQFTIWEIANAPIFRNDNLSTLSRSDMITFASAATKDQP